MERAALAGLLGHVPVSNDSHSPAVRSDSVAVHHQGVRVSQIQWIEVDTTSHRLFEAIRPTFSSLRRIAKDTGHLAMKNDSVAPPQLVFGSLKLRWLLAKFQVPFDEGAPSSSGASARSCEKGLHARQGKSPHLGEFNPGETFLWYHNIFESALSCRRQNAYPVGNLIFGNAEMRGVFRQVHDTGLPTFNLKLELFTCPSR